jgi:hypothetical protein
MRTLMCGRTFLLAAAAAMLAVTGSGSAATAKTVNGAGSRGERVVMTAKNKTLHKTILVTRGRQVALLAQRRAAWKVHLLQLRVPVALEAADRAEGHKADGRPRPVDGEAAGRADAPTRAARCTRLSMTTNAGA